MTTTEITKPTREQAWAILLDIWRTGDLPTPREISVTDYGVIDVWCDDNDRAAVTAWAEALDIDHPKFKKATTGRGGWFKASGIPSDAKQSPMLPDWYVGVTCCLDLDADASVHWAGPAVVDALPRDARTELAAHLEAKAAAPTFEPGELDGIAANAPTPVVEPEGPGDGHDDEAAEATTHVAVDDWTCSCGWKVDGFTAPEFAAEKLREKHIIPANAAVAR